MSKMTREIISRCTMAVLALGLLYGAYVCFSTAYNLHREWVEDHPVRVSGRDSSGAGLPALIGCVLGAVGGFFLVAAVVPSHVLLRMFGMPKATLHDHPDVGHLPPTWL